MSDRLLHDTIDYKGYAIKIYYDTDYTSSRKEWDNLGVIYSSHRDCNPDGHKIDEILDEYYNWEFSDAKSFEDYLDEFYYWLPIGYYEHGGITIWAGQPSNDWDSGTFGIIVVSKEAARKEYGANRPEEEVHQSAISCLEGEIKTLDMEYRGEIYGYVIEVAERDEDDEDEETPELPDIKFDSCWGFYGDEGIEEAVAECKGIIDSELEEFYQKESERVAREKKFGQIYESTCCD